MAKQKRFSPQLQVWVDARKRFHLSHAQVQMARELGMNPKKLGGMANHRQEPWKLPLPQYIEQLYFKRFKKERPDSVRPIEQIAADKKQKQADRRELKRQPRQDSRPENAAQPPVQPDCMNAAVEDDDIPF